MQKDAGENNQITLVMIDCAARQRSKASRVKHCAETFGCIVSSNVMKLLAISKVHDEKTHHKQGE